MTFLIIFLAIVLLGDIYTFISLKQVMPKNHQLLFWLITIVFYASFCALYFARALHIEMSKTLLGFAVTLLIGLFLFKAVLVLTMLLGDITRLGQWLFSKINPDSSVDLSRKKFVGQMALILGAIPFAATLWGMLRNAYNFKVYKENIAIKNLPNGLRDLKVVQISDLHTGSMIYPEKLMKAVNMINDLKPDLILFTGDIVNATTDECYPFVDILKQLSANFGVYSVLGNHDYGHYGDDKSDAAIAKHRKTMLDLHRKKLGWKLLLNENEVIEINGEKLGLIGVENISAQRWFGKYGNLKKAYKGCEECSLKILMSHDPSHWEMETTKDFKNINLTLSGHTHGFQFGVEIPWLKWSPVQYVYKQWAGLYKKDDQYLYVNRGIGHLGYPGRVGILPEITLLSFSTS